MNIIKHFFKKTIDFVINQRLINFFVLVYKRVFEEKISRAVGNYHLSLIKKQGENCRFIGKVNVYYDYGLQLGNHVRIGSNSFIFAMGGVEIGDNTQISRNVTIYSANHNVEGSHIPYDDQYVCASVKIGHSVWIGMNVMILPGVTIGDGAVIGMGAIVTKDVQPGEVVVNGPQRVVKRRDLDKFYEKKDKELLFAKAWPDK